jgi:hypothetical protein
LDRLTETETAGCAGVSGYIQSLPRDCRVCWCIGLHSVTPTRLQDVLVYRVIFSHSHETAGCAGVSGYIQSLQRDCRVCCCIGLHSVTPTRLQGVLVYRVTFSHSHNAPVTNVQLVTSSEAQNDRYKNILYLSTKSHGVTSHDAINVIITALRTLNLTIKIMIYKTEIFQVMSYNCVLWT